MGAAEFGEWQAFYEIEPFGGVRGDLQVAQMMSLLANIHRDPRKQPSPFPVADFMVDFWRIPTATASPNSLAAKFSALTTPHNGD